MSWSPQQDRAISDSADAFYVYVHLRNDTGRPFYVGKGSGERATCHYNRNRHWTNIANKYGFLPHIVVQQVDEELAFLAEVELIDLYRRIGVKLTNMTIGGDGVSLVGEARERFAAKMRDPEVNARRSASLKVALADPDVRRRVRIGQLAALNRDDVVRAKIRAATKANNARPEVRKKISDSATAYWARPGVKEARLGPLLAASTAVCAKAVICVETDTVFRSFADAARWLREAVNPKAGHAPLVHVCKGKLKTAYGYHWQYAQDITRAAERVTVVI